MKVSRRWFLNGASSLALLMGAERSLAAIHGSASAVASQLPQQANIVANFSASNITGLTNGQSLTTSSLVDSVNGIAANTIIGTAPVYATNRLGGKPSFQCTNGGLQIATPGVLRTALDSTNYTIFVVFRQLGSATQGSLFGAWNSIGDLLMYADGTTIGQQSNFYWPYASTGLFSTYAMASTSNIVIGSGGPYIAYAINGGIARGTYATLGSNAHPIIIGTGNTSNANPANAEIFDIIIWNTKLEQPDLLRAQKWACDRYAQPYPWASDSYFLMYDGSSQSEGDGETTGNNGLTFPALTAKALGLSYGQWGNVATGAATTAQINSVASTRLDPVPSVVGVPMVLDAYQWFNGQTATSYTDAVTYLAARKSANPTCKIVWATNTDGAFPAPTATTQANRAAYNAYFDAHHSPIADNIDSYIPLHTDVHFGIVGSAVQTGPGITSPATNYFNDALHLNDVGQAIEADWHFSAILQVLPASRRQAQVNLNNANPESYGQEWPWINCAKMFTPWQPFGAPTGDVFGAISPTTGIPQNFPTGITGWRCQGSVYVLPPSASNGGAGTGSWIMSWDGTANLDISTGTGTTSINIISSTANSINFDVVSNNAADITVTGVCAPSGGNTNITISGASANTVWIGSRLIGTGIPWDATIGSQQSGTTNGNGVYQVNTAAPTFTTSSGTVTLACVQNGEQVRTFTHINSMSVPPTLIKIYRADYATLQTAGQITSPEFKNFFQRYGVFRTMDFQYTNGNLTAAWADRPLQSNNSWLGSNMLTAYCGQMSQSANTFTTASTLSGSPTSWVDGMLVQGVFTSLPAFSSIIGISNANPCQITTQTAHGLTTGQKVSIPLGGIASTGSGVSIEQAFQWTNPTTTIIPCPPVYTATVIDSTHFTLNGIDSTSWQTFQADCTFTVSISGTTATISGISSNQLSTGMLIAGAGIASNTLITNANLNGGGNGTYTVSVSQTAGPVSASGYSGKVGPQLQVATTSLPAKRVVSNNTQALYYPTTQNVLGGTPIANVGSPWSFVYNAALDACLAYVGPADESGQLLGAPLSVIVQMANEINVPPWICMPVNATDNHFLQAATYMKANLNSNLRARIELSNEIWNGSFIAYGFANSMAGLQIGETGSGGFLSGTAGYEWVGWRFYNAMAQVNSAYSGAMNQIYRMLATNGNNNSNTAATVAIFEAPNSGLSPAKPYQRADAFAIAPYLEADRSTFPTGQAVYNYKIGSTSAAFSAVDAWFNVTPTDGIVFSINLWGGSPGTTLNFWAGIAAQYGIEMHQYEGGWGVYPNQDQNPSSYNPGGGPVTLTTFDTLSMWQAYKASTNWGVQYANALAGYKAAGGKFASNYWINSALWNFNNMFGSNGQSVFSTPAPYYTTGQPTPEKQAFDAYNVS